MVAHHKIVRFLDNFRTMIFITSELWWDEEVRLKLLVDIDLTFLNSDRITFFSDYPFNKRFIWVAGIKQHDYVTGFWFAEETISRFIDNQSILVLEGWLHTLSFNPSYLEPEGDDQRRIHCSRRKGLYPSQ